MANLMQIKRSESTATPTSLANGELAWSGVSDALFIGNFGSVAQIGGLVIDSDTMSGANATNLASAESIKAYVDSVAGAGVSDLNDVSDVNAGSATGGHVLTWDATESKWVDADLVGGNGINTITYDQSTDSHTISVQAANNTISVAAGGIAVNETNLSITESQISDLGTYLTDITGENLGDLSDVTITAAASGEFLRYNGSAWVDSAIQTGDITSGMVTQHEGDLTITESQISDLGSYLTSVALNDVTDVTITAAASGEFLRYNGSAWVDSAIQNGDITSGMVTQHQASLSITESQISDLGSYLTAETNDLTSAVTWANVPDANITETSVTQHEAALSITASQISDDIALGTDTSGNYVATIAGTANEISVSGSGSETAAVTIGLPDDVTIGRDLTVTGNLVVQGTTTTIDTTQLLVEDNLIRLATNNSGDTTDFGLYGVYNDGAQKYAGIVRDASDSGTFKLLEGITTEPTGTTVTGGTLAALDVGALSAGATTLSSLSLTTDLAVTHGGTGASSFTDNGIIYGNGTSALSVTSAGTEGQVLQAGASGVPEFGTLDGGTF